MKKAAETRSASPYAHRAAILVDWTRPPTISDEVIMMERVMFKLDIECEEYPLIEWAHHPEWGLIDGIRATIKRFQETNEKCLIVICYVGCGKIIDGELNLINDDDNQKVPWSKIKEYLFGNHRCMQNIDALAILDCCYTEVAKRGNHLRKAEVIASGRIGTERKDGEIDSMAFTLRLLEALEKFEKFGKKGSVTTAELYQELRYNAAEQDEDDDYDSDQAWPIPVMEPPVSVEPIKLVFRKFDSSPRSTLEKDIVARLTLKADNMSVKLLCDAVSGVSDKVDVEVMDVHGPSQ